MPTLSVFNNATVDGYFTDKNNDMSWAYSTAEDPEFAAFTAENAKGGGALLMGRKTHDLMAKYWPTPQAKKDNPSVAEGMNRMRKIVFSRSLTESPWANTTFVKGD